jgi:hypothetical protein
MLYEIFAGTGFHIVRGVQRLAPRRFTHLCHRLPSELIVTAIRFPRRGSPVEGQTIEQQS